MRTAILCLFYSIVSACAAPDVCFKYEPLFNNQTGSTALTVVKVSPWEICKLAEKCKAEEADMFNAQFKTFSLTEMCPLPTPTPQPAPTVKIDPRFLYLTAYNDLVGLEHKNYSSVSSSSRSEMCSVLRSAQDAAADDTVYTAMCILNDDWADMCPASLNATFEDDSTRPKESQNEDQYCYIVKRSIASPSEDGICNITLASQFLDQEFLKMNNLRNSPEDQSFNQSLVLFNVYQHNDMCEVVASKSLVVKEPGQCKPEEEQTDRLPVCPYRNHSSNATVNTTPFSLRAFFANKLDLKQCNAL
uniref:Uncharacterized protein n=1 Tax=Ciona savignyi TaxID=51511 RepID=H2YB24_CIOSA